MKTAKYNFFGPASKGLNSSPEAVLDCRSVFPNCRYPSIGHRLKGNQSYNSCITVHVKPPEHVTKCAIIMSFIVKTHLFINTSLIMFIYVHLCKTNNFVMK